ncbi:MAG: penicillin-binding protein, partial [Patescibacteria group bacterium]|nr:penicillin-binding protein [Patescibacteria group bacterium]
ISQNIKDATLSIEDKEFYTHHGFKPTAIIRAFFQNILSLSLSQGGSTITQQVVKNTILTLDKTPTRKLKELVLSLKLDRMLPKDDIFNMYLNEIPYGGSIYGVEEASETYFGKPASDVTIAEAAYLASIPQRPTYYSPYGKNKDKLEERKNLVLKEMLRDGKIDETKYNEAVNEKVTFLPKEDRGIKAPHFVMFVKEYLEEKYGQDVLEQGGLKVTTTLNYELQKKAEDVAKRYAFENKKNFNGENAAFVAIDPKTGGILSMVGSRDYFDKEIDGNFNVTTAHRQPGSTFKPFVYAESFLKGYTPDTVLFDLKTQFSVKCAPENMTSTNGCYSPENYDGNFRGPMTLRDALAQSINIPSVKLLYLAGIADSINLARSMGIQSLGDANQYGLTLVLGGGEVSLLDMTSAYGVFANDGVRNPYVSILKVEDKNGKTLEELNPKPMQVLDPEAARKISDILSDNVARSPGYGTNSPLYFAGRDVAVKTGTTNDYKDTWIIGYTPSVVVGAWAGNNNNTPMEKKVAGLIVAPMWRAFMDEVVKTLPINDQFTKPQQENSLEIKPVLRGKWQGGISTITPSPTGGETESLSGGVHSILYWLDKDDPRGEQPGNPSDDPQFVRWEYPVRLWVQQQGLQ